MQKSLLLVITLYPYGQYGGWRSDNYTQCDILVGDKFIECIENTTYYKFGNNINQNKFLSAKYFYAGNRQVVMGQNLEVRRGAITHRSTSSLQIPVNDSLHYIIFITDPKMHYLTYAPNMIFGIAIEREANKAISNMVSIKVLLTTGCPITLSTNRDASHLQYCGTMWDTLYLVFTMNLM